MAAERRATPLAADVNAARLALAWELAGDDTPIGIGGVCGALGLAYAMAAPPAQSELNAAMGVRSFDDVVSSHSNARVLAVLATPTVHAALSGNADVLARWARLHATLLPSDEDAEARLNELVANARGPELRLPRGATGAADLALVALEQVHATWPTRLDAEAGTFLARGGVARSVTMCTATRTVECATTDAYELVRLPCKDAADAVVLARPLGDASWRRPPRVDEHAWRTERVRLAFPRFRASSGVLQLGKPLGSRVPALFDGHASVFDVLHMATFGVDENGATAAAVTVATVWRCSSPPVREFRCDRPFVAIFERRGLVEFVVKVCDPA